MRAFLAATLAVIAVGVLLIAYGLLSQRVTAAPLGAPTLQETPVHDVGLASEPDRFAGPGTLQTRYESPYGDPYRFARTPLVSRGGVRPLRTSTYGASRHGSFRRDGRSSGHHWRKTALVVGGSTAAGAGLGAIFGGKTGALIGAAIGGGASALYEATRR